MLTLIIKELSIFLCAFLFHLFGNLFFLYFTKKKKKKSETNWKWKKNWSFITEFEKLTSIPPALFGPRNPSIGHFVNNLKNYFSHCILRNVGQTLARHNSFLFNNFKRSSGFQESQIPNPEQQFLLCHIQLSCNLKS